MITHSAKEPREQKKTGERQGGSGVVSGWIKFEKGDKQYEGVFIK